MWLRGGLGVWGKEGEGGRWWVRGRREGEGTILTEFLILQLCRSFLKEHLGCGKVRSVGC